MEQIKNDQLTLEISSLGAELQSIKDANGNEYLWDGDEKYWNRHFASPSYRSAARPFACCLSSFRLYKHHLHKQHINYSACRNGKKGIPFP